MIRKLRNNILIGLVLITPLAVTAFTINWLFTLSTNFFLAFLPKMLREGDNAMLRRLLALLVALGLLFLIGFFVRHYAGRRLYLWGERLLTRVPFINRIYIFVRQLLATVFAQQQTMFKEVVLFQYPRPGVYAMGFVTSAVPSNITSRLEPLREGDEYLSVFVPTAPNPTSGWFYVVARSQLTPLPISTGDAMKLILSGGSVFPGSGPQPEESDLLSRLEHWLAQQGRSGAELPVSGTSPEQGAAPRD